MNTKKDMQDTIQLMQDLLQDGSTWSANNGDFLGEELSELQKLLILMRNKLKNSKIK